MDVSLSACKAGASSAALDLYQGSLIHLHQGVVITLFVVETPKYLA